jgi:hypothetical protein
MCAKTCDLDANSSFKISQCANNLICPIKKWNQAFLSLAYDSYFHLGLAIKPACM